MRALGVRRAAKATGMDNDALRRLHSFTGLVPLGVYLGFHAWEHWPARDGRDAELARLTHTSSAWLEILCVLLPLLLHAGLGLTLARTVDDSLCYASKAFRTSQMATGIGALLFIGWHVLGVWLPRVLDAGRAATAYGAMLDQSGTALGAGLYVLGLSAVCVHFGQGLASAWIRYVPEVPTRLARGVGVVLGAVLWLVLLNELAVYATGAPLL